MGSEGKFWGGCLAPDFAASPFPSASFIIACAFCHLICPTAEAGEPVSSRVWLTEAAASLTSARRAAISEDLTSTYNTDAKRIRTTAAIPPYQSVSRHRSVGKALPP